MSQAPVPSPTSILVPVSGHGVAADYAASLLEHVGVDVHRIAGPTDTAPPAAWARSGAMSLTGPANGPPLSVDAPVASCAEGAARALVGLARGLFGVAPQLDGAALLGERAALAEPPLTRAGAASVGGSARLLACSDGWIALNLARPEDEALLPAWLECDANARIEAHLLEAQLGTRKRDELVARGRMMGMAVAAVPDTAQPEEREAWLDFSAQRHATALPQRTPLPTPLVVDCSSLWAGPLCGQLLAACGARVLKVESVERPDGARRGSAAFFDLLNGDKQSVALALSSAGGQHALNELLRRADIVIESSRPRAFEQLEISANEIVDHQRSTWVSITGYGRRPAFRDWIAFGDDAAASAGLVARFPDGSPCFCGDAIADPLTGLHAAFAALASWGTGGGRLLDVSLAGVSRNVRGFPGAFGDDAAREEPVPPRARPVRTGAPAMGSDTERLLASHGIRC